MSIKRIITNKVSGSKERDAALKEAMAVNAGINKAAGDFTVVMADTLRPVSRIPTGILALDVALSGGLPCGYVIEVYGPEGSGKSTIAMKLAATVQSSPEVFGKPVAFIDVEGTLNTDWAALCGIDTKYLVTAMPTTAEVALDIVETMVRSNKYSVVILDSVAALLPQEEAEKTHQEQSMGLHARLMSKFCRKVTSALNVKDENGDKNRTVVLLVNQTRDKIGGFTRPGMPVPQQTSGGRAVRYHASLRLELKVLEFISGVNKVEIGQIIKFKVIKAKFSKSRETGTFDLYFCGCEKDGVKHKKAEIDNTSALIELALKHEAVHRHGSKYDLGVKGKTETITGRENLITYIRENVPVQESLKKKLIALTFEEPENGNK